MNIKIYFDNLIVLGNSNILSTNLLLFFPEVFEFLINNLVTSSQYLV